MLKLLFIDLKKEVISKNDYETSDIFYRMRVILQVCVVNYWVMKVNEITFMSLVVSKENSGYNGSLAKVTFV